MDQEDVYTLFKWNGTQYSFPLLETTITLASPPGSRWWYFQELAARIGPERMQEYIDKIGYATKTSWRPDHLLARPLSADFRALEQVDRSTSYSGQPLFSAANTAILQRTSLLSEDGGTKLMGKTGSAPVTEKWVSRWFVGCVNKDGRYYVFATNIEAADGANGGKAREITKSILKEMGIL